MTDTEWTRYAFLLPGDAEPHRFGSVSSLPCEVTIHRDGKVFVHLGTEFSRGPSAHLSDEQMQALVAKWHALKENHRG